MVGHWKPIGTVWRTGLDMRASLRPALPGSVRAVEGTRVDAWLWSVRLFRTRSSAAAACRAGHVRVNGRSAKPATPVVEGDEVRARTGSTDRVVEVVRLLSTRVGAPIAVECYVDRSPAPPPVERTAPVAHRERGAGRPTKRERRDIDRLRGRDR
jgi:ribosome-associated heat shock protein Hsp15